MSKVISKDGALIAYERAGSGPAIILVDGALCYRGFGPMPELAARLTPHFTVYTYDRRGRGESSDVLPYAVDREIEDLAALIQAAGGSAILFGVSSGAALALDAAGSGLNLTGLALYEPPYNVNNTRKPVAQDYTEQYATLLVQGRRGDMVEHFMVDGVGEPPEAVAGMRASPVWPVFEAVAHTLAYDAEILEQDSWLPSESAARVKAPTLLMYGGASPAWAAAAIQGVAELIPHARVRSLAGQTHQVAAEVVAPELIEFFASADGAPAGGDLPAGIGAPAQRALEQAGITRLEQLAAHTETELANLHGMGPKALGILRAALNERGLSFAQRGERDANRA